MQPAFTTPVGVGRATFVGMRPGNKPLCPVSRRAFPVPAAAPAVGPAVMPPQAKLFDWKKRADPEYATLPEEDDGVFKLHNIRPAPGSHHRKKRKGRGDATGNGARCGFGMRGQKSRSGRGPRAGFEGGQTPLYRRQPKWVGRPMGPGHKRTEYALIKPDMLNECAEGDIVTFEKLREDGVLTRQKRKIYKVVGGADVTVKGLTVKAHAFTTSAVEAIEGAGGTCVLVSPTTGKDIVIEDDAQEDEAEA